MILVSCNNMDPTKYYKIINVRSQFVLGVQGSSLNNSALVYQYIDSSLDSMLWSVTTVSASNNTYRILNKNSGMAFTCASANGSNCIQTTLNTSRNDQIFHVASGPGGCFIQPYPFKGYVVIAGCSMYSSNLAQTWYYYESTCERSEQFIFFEWRK